MPDFKRQTITIYRRYLPYRLTPSKRHTVSPHSRLPRHSSHCRCCRVGPPRAEVLSVSRKAAASSLIFWLFWQCWASEGLLCRTFLHQGLPEDVHGSAVSRAPSKTSGKTAGVRLFCDISQYLTKISYDRCENIAIYHAIYA